MKRNITKQLCVCVAVYELLTALLAVDTASVGNSSNRCVRRNINLD